MRWEDERYVRLYTRDTTDWLLWPWQSRAVFPLLMRKADRAGMLQLGKHGLRGLAPLLALPPEVIEPGVAGLLEDGCLVLNGETLVLRNFVEAQEATASNAKRCRDHRAKLRDEALSDTKRVASDTKHVATDTPRHAATRADTPSRAVPCLAVPCLETTCGQPSADPPAVNGPTKAKKEKPTDPRHQPLVERLTATFLAVRGTKYGFGGVKDAAAVTSLLKLSDGNADEVDRRWRRALELNDKWPGCSTIALLPAKWNELAANGRDFTKGRVGAEEVDWANGGGWR